MHQALVVVMYLFYGLSFFILGLLSFFLRGEKSSTDIFLRNLPLLGYFGIFHGLAEWTALVLESGLANEFMMPIRIIIIVLNGLSFIFLVLFGLALNKERRGLILAIWGSLVLGGLIFWMGGKSTSGDFYRYSDRFLRFCVATPAAFMSGFGLYRQGRGYHYEVKQNIGLFLILLSLLFTLYGVAVSLISPIIGRLNIRPEFIRTILAIASGLVIVILGFRIREAEQNRIWAFKEGAVIHRERERLGRELHDRVLQKLFAAGLTIDRCLEKGYSGDEDVQLTRQLISESSGEIRGFLSETEERLYSLGEFFPLYEDECIRLSRSFSILIKPATRNKLFKRDIDLWSVPHLSDVFAILEEAVSNAVHHGRVQTIYFNLFLERDVDQRVILGLEVSDKGIGFNLDEVQMGNGLRFMKNRARSLGGSLEIEGDQGTRINLSIPLVPVEV